MNDSGIHSFAGFLYQVDVFIYLAFKYMSNGKLFTFEGIDDIDIDSLDDALFTCTGLDNRRIQVKKTSYTSKLLTILANWVEDFDELYTFEVITKSSSGKIEIFSKDIIEKFVLKVIENKAKRDVYSRIYSNYNVEAGEESLREVINKINSNSKSIKLSSIEQISIEESSKKTLTFKSTDLNLKLYNEIAKKRYFYIRSRIQEEILDCIRKEKPYILSDENFSLIVNHAINKINIDQVIDYKDVKEKSLPIVDAKYNSKDREVVQLKSTNISKNQILTQLQNMFYYEKNKDLREAIEMIEVFDKFERIGKQYHDIAVGILKEENNDTPTLRYYKTIEKSISEMEQEMNYGLYIHLTREKVIKELKVTFKEDNEIEKVWDTYT